MSFIHSTAEVDDDVTIGDGTRIWSNTQIRSGAVLGSDCNIGRNCFVDLDVVIGDRVKIQNNASLYEGVQVESGVFIGPHVSFTNDKVPRAVTPDGRLKSTDDWVLTRTVVRYGAALGAGAILVAGIEVGRWAMVGAGSVVTKDVPDHALVLGNPGRVVGYVSASGVRCETQEAARALSEAETTDSTRSS